VVLDEIHDFVLAGGVLDVREILPQQTVQDRMRAQRYAALLQNVQQRFLEVLENCDFLFGALGNDVVERLDLFVLLES
jgi:hypothetical protein